MIQGLTPGRDKKFFSSHNCPDQLCGTHPASYALGTRDIKAACSPPSSAKVENEGSYTYTCSVCPHGLFRDNFTLPCIELFPLFSYFILLCWLLQWCSTECDV